jgi:Asp-tRNA(Asn)/Glu-tRNA(Gln) amidotransferase A subunit family amidase
MPVGLQIIAPRLEEERLLEIANVYEKNTSWKEKMMPKGFDD